MNCDIAVVVFRPRWRELTATLKSLSAVQSEFRLLRVLVSGSLDDRDNFQSAVEREGLDTKTVIHHRFDNLGFAGGQNYLLSMSFEHGADWVLVYNPDLEVQSGALSAFLSKCRSRGSDNLYGPWIYASSSSAFEKKLDSRGIAWTSTSRHFDIDSLGHHVDVDGEFTTVQGLTGACLLVPCSVYAKLCEYDGEFFDQSFVAYREDAELGVRAAAYGIRSLSVQMDGVYHERGIPTASRKSSLVNLLSVQNRFLMRWKLAGLRPGKVGLPSIRDLTVVLACLTVERSSLAGLQGAYRIRRYAKYKGWRFNRTDRTSRDSLRVGSALN